MKRAVVLLSGGLDSATVLAMAASEGYETYALSFRYGQRHVGELDAAAAVARRLGAREHAEVAFDLRRFGGSALTGDIAVPKDRPRAEMSAGISVTYVPARNTIFLSFGLAWTETLSAATSSSASMRWTIPVIPIAVPSTSPPTRRWPTWRPGPALRGRSG